MVSPGKCKEGERERERERERVINTELNDEKILKDTSRMCNGCSPVPAADALDLGAESGSAQSSPATSREQILEPQLWWQLVSWACCTPELSS